MSPKVSNADARFGSGTRGLVFYLTAFITLALIVPPAHAEIRWSSGAVSTPSQMQPAELAQTAARLARRSDQGRIVIHFDGPVQMPQRAALESSGIQLLSYLGGYAYFATLTTDVDIAGFAQIPGTLSVEAVDPANKLHPDLARGIAQPWSVVAEANETQTSPEVAVYVLFHKDFDLGRFVPRCPRSTPWWPIYPWTT